MTPKREPLPLLEVANRAELRAWLAANHATSNGVTLAIGKKGHHATELSYEDAVLEGLCFGWIDSTAHRLDEDRYTTQFTPRKPGGTWAATNKARIEKLVAEGLMTPAGMEVIERAKTDGSWESIDSVDAHVMPDDLRDALAADPTAQTFWNSLPPGAQKLSYHWLAMAKRPETRAKRLAEIVRAAHEGRRIY